MTKISLNILPALKKWFVEKANVLTVWNTTASDSQIPSEKLVKTELDKKATTENMDAALRGKIDKISIKTVVNDTLTNEDVVGGKAVYDEIKKVEAGIPSGMEHTDITDWDTATADFEKGANKVTNLSSPDNTKYPTAKAVSDGLSTKIDNSSKTTELTNASSDTQIPSAKAVYDLYSTIPKWHVEMVASIEDLPTTGVLGTIYLVSDSGSGKNQYKEFFWNDSASEPGYEQFGGVEIDVSKFITKKQMTDYLANNSTLTLSDGGELALNIVDATE